ncbi:tRNA (adenosine(37)-N6)-threonylcarbamoyltransferase complex dimerization subunit type 1 TsaB [Sphingomonas paeninsulae]|uniref:tRNA (Adenosine(37)-N6)-threonylcarbamoyltransferase complex dimerization subunit type 1 TsaB n=1 Tax=Sphingomonas paeninsulae TaxID=2319844 RepID=A0A494TAY9_SPHPE|nr:tRNA (adenosine(37)-N6)-threonylcarbamoyltransferase complex dimerization subunit type 1 TsaB [Sphingomonas paeninsulae]
MRTLVIETATSVCSVALIENGAVVAAAHENVGRGHAERLLPMIAALPDGGRASSILVDCGPGSFTGIRVGVAAARGLGLGWGVSVSGFSSLALLATGHLALHPDEAVTVAINAGHGQIFVQSFECAPVAELDALASLFPDAAVAVACNVVVGNAAADIVDRRGTGQAVERTPDARDAVFLSPNLSALPAVPIYGRGADAKPMAVTAHSS